MFLVDDDSDIRQALQSLLRSVALHVEAYDSVEGFLAAERLDAPGCLVLDVRLSGQSGLKLQGELLKLNVKIPIIFISGHADVQMAVRAMKEGAVEFLTKPIRPQELIDAIHAAFEIDRRWRDEALSIAEKRSALGLLTPREREVMILIVAGHGNKEVAARLGISELTVKAHRGHIMQKMSAASLPQLVRIAIELGL